MDEKELRFGMNILLLDKEASKNFPADLIKLPLIKNIFFMIF